MPDDLSHLSDREHVRERPAMYIGDTRLRGLHHLAFEIIENAIAVNEGHARNIAITLNSDGSLTVHDDGSGIPVIRHAALSDELGRSITSLEASLTVLKYDSGSRWRIDGGLHGVGPVIVNFLSEWCEVQAWRGGKAYRQSYREGVPTGTVSCTEDDPCDGTRITFQPDRELFQTTDFVYERIRQRVEELAFLCAGVRFALNDERTGKTDVFCWKQGSVDYVVHRNRRRRAVHPDIIHLRGESEGIQFEIALQYCLGCQEDVNSFANLVRSHGFAFDYAAGGTHVSGFRRALSHTLEQYGKDQGVFVDVAPTDRDFYSGLTAVVSVQLPHARWEGSTKSLLANAEAEHVVDQALGSYLPSYLANNPRTAAAILRKTLHSAHLRREFPPIDNDLFLEQECLLRKPEEDPEGWGARASFPTSYKVRMIKRNGGELRTATDVWRLFPVRDETNQESLDRTKRDVIRQTKLAYGRPGFPESALAIAENDRGDLLLFIRRTDRICGEKYPNPYADDLYRWCHSSGELDKIADDFDELGWAPCGDEKLFVE